MGGEGAARLMSRLDELLAKAKTLPPMTVREKQEQKLGFAWGNLACSSNHKPTRAPFEETAKDWGWTEAEFEKWASDKEWW